MVYVQEELLEVFIYKHTPKYIAKKVQKKKVQRSLLKGLPFILILVASSCHCFRTLNRRVSQSFFIAC